MNTADVLFVRIYLTESSSELASVLKYLKTQSGLRGASVFRAISGFGSSGEHESSLIDLSLDLPLIIEFFDTRAIVEPVLEHLADYLAPQHLVFWEAKAHSGA